MDPWWNDAVNQQAFSRSVRFGQKKETECVRIYLVDSIDHRITKLKDLKCQEFQKIEMKGQIEGYAQPNFYHLI
jgi:SNF2 family DNA or RNA helicase